ncbi:MAG: hypothetical protein PHF37_09990 [Phycisphaerae bacterium]|nr:hypothetical protein [Phycisphaerae bacterium]
MRPIEHYPVSGASYESRMRIMKIRNDYACTHEDDLAAWRYDDAGKLYKVRDDNWPAIRRRMAQARQLEKQDKKQ